MKKIISIALLASSLFLAGCSATINHTPSPQLQPESQWAVTPFVNNTETPRAGDRAAAITSGLLRARGIEDVTYITPKMSSKGLLSEHDKNKRAKKAMAIAKSRHMRYVMTGEVNEWRYKAGLDGEPVVGVTLRLVDTQTGKTIWSAVASDSGWSRSSISDIAQDMINKSLASLPVV